MLAAPWELWAHRERELAQNPALMRLRGAGRSLVAGRSLIARRSLVAVWARQLPRPGQRHGVASCCWAGAGPGWCPLDGAAAGAGPGAAGAR